MTCPGDSEKGVDLDYTAKGLTLLAAYMDRQERRLVTVSLDPKLNNCDGPAESA